MPPAIAVARLAVACAVDRVRRPAFPVTVVLFGALLALLPHLGNAAAGVEDNARLALELTVSSLLLCGVLWAGLQAVDPASSAPSSGPPPELLALPGGARVAVLGLWASCALTAVALVVGAALVGSAGWIWSAGRIPGLTLEHGALAVLGCLCGCALASALGLLYALWSTPTLASLALVVHVGITRGLTSGTTDEAGVRWVHLLPDPTRLDLAADLAFGHPVAWGSVAAGVLAASVQTAALLLLCVAATRRKAR